MEQDFLSNIELYYSAENAHKDFIRIFGDEYKHAFKVMRNEIGGVLYVTNGQGVIYKTIIDSISKDFSELKIVETIKYKNYLENITLYLPNLKNNDRFEFALEKCVELGITNFVIYCSDRTFTKSFKKDRWDKIALAAMKQSLRSFIPNITFLEHLVNISLNGNYIFLDQSSETDFYNYFSNYEIVKNSTSIIIGPEGGFSEREYKVLEKAEKLKIAPNRLRSETASITTASLLNSIFNC